MDRETKRRELEQRDKSELIELIVSSELDLAIDAAGLRIQQQTYELVQDIHAKVESGWISAADWELLQGIEQRAARQAARLTKLDRKIPPK